MRDRTCAAFVSLLLLAACAGPTASPSPSLVHSGPSPQPPSTSAAASAPATSSWEPTGLGLDNDGNLLVTDCLGGGAAIDAKLADPNGMVFDAAGNLYFVDDLANAVRRMGLDGIITTVAGTGDAGFSGDGGPGTAATLNTPGDIIFDAAGNLYIADFGNHRIRVLHPDGGIDTFATGLS